MTASDLHSAWARLFIGALASAGVVDLVLSPGSRSTPLALAAAAEPRLRLHVVLDERAAGFFAVGQARITGRPSVLVCTSGTAGAHYLPALIEAAQSFVPVIAITADRPWELYDAAAPQTIDQTKLFGDVVRHYAELGLPDASRIALRAVQRIAAQAFSRALGPIPGPVHVNARFRKPLEPVEVDAPEPWEAEVAALARRGPPRVAEPSLGVDPALVSEIVERCMRAERGLIVCGPALGRDQVDLAPAVVAFARATGFPLLPEATSQARFGGAQAGVTVCAGFDAALRSERFRAEHAPDLVIEIGAPPTSSAYARFVEQHRDAARVVIAPHGWNDPSGGASLLALAPPAALLTAVARKIDPRARDDAWARSFAAADAQVWSAASAELEGDTLTEGAIAREVASGCPEGSVLVVGNSTPVRDLDTWAPASSRSIRVLHQRGASGIDGLLSGAAGSQTVALSPVTLLIGDVSLLHDLNGLEIARRAEGPLVIVVINNDGGRIFEQLPIGARPGGAAVLERCFTTPHGLAFEAFARGFGVRYEAPRGSRELASALATAWSTNGATLIECKVPPHDGAERARRLWARVDRALSAG